MWAGTSALKNIDQKLKLIRSDTISLDSKLATLTDSISSNHRSRASLLNKIAAVRLAEIESGELNLVISETDRQVAKLLEQRQIALAALTRKINDTGQQIETAEGERVSLLEQVNQCAEKVVKSEGQVQAALKEDKVYLAQLSQAQTAESIAEEALQKAQRAESDMAEKAEPYQNDELFMYLWQRWFGTADYHAGLLVRSVDAWLAKLINYEPARVNYWNLVEIPKRLTQHAQRVGDEADRQHALLAETEDRALHEAGVKALEDELNALRAELDQHDDGIEAMESDLNDYLVSRETYLSGSDEYINECITIIAKSLEHQNLAAIHRYVRDTRSYSDDDMVVELQSLQDELVNVEEDLADIKRMYQRKFSKLRELEKIRQDFKNSRFDDVRSGFANRALIESVLSRFLQGEVSGVDVWRTIKRNQRYQQLASSPDFGSGGLGEIVDAIGGEIVRQGRRRRSRRHSSWQWPSPRNGGGGFNMPGGSGGGFKTGGGF